MEQILEQTLNSNITAGYNMELADRKQTHLARKIWHVTGVGIVTWLFYILPYNVALGLISGFSILFIGLDFLRFKAPAFKNLVTKIMGLFMRKEELDKPTGLSFMCVGFWLLILLFDRDVALLTMLFVMLGDPIAAYIGTKYGKDKIGDKSVQGFLACFAVCVVVALVYLRLIDFNSSRIIYVSLLAALVGSGAELVQINKIDDNLSMPVISGILLTILFSLTA
jgi:diacylglycerol kinase (CTP)